jgi:hypothetical protein
MYYSYDTDRPQDHNKPSFIYNHKRHNEVAVNLLLAKGSYNTEKVRSNLALMFGNYAQYNLSSEPTWAQFINEANIGVKLSSTKNIWIDAGILPSHIGFESAIGADCWTLSRGLIAEGSPYYETGAKLSYSNENNTFTTSLLYLNGWQKIARPDFISRPSFGMQLYYKPKPNLTLNYSNFYGTDKPDEADTKRFFNNFYVIFEPGSKFGFTLGYDIGIETTSDASYTFGSSVMMIKYNISPVMKFVVRGEYYFDEQPTILPFDKETNISGLSANFDYLINNNCLWRIEAKRFNANRNIFSNSNSNENFTTSLSIKI